MASNCPKCSNPLHDFHVEGMAFDICPGCNGSWFDGDELLYYLKPRLGCPDLSLIEKNARPTQYRCPRCLVQLGEIRFSLSSGMGAAVVSSLMVDRCPQCKGVWLDAGELANAIEIGRGIPEAEAQLQAAFRSIRQENHRLYNELNGNRLSKSHLTTIFASIFVLVAIFVYSSVPSRKYGDGRPVSSSRMGARECPTCRGTGKHVHVCDVCQGSGRSVVGDKVACPECGGSGQHARASGYCARCGGSGSVTEASACLKCAGNGTVARVDKQTCYTCTGTGQMRVRENCAVCGSTGKSSVNPQWNCPNCNGRGYTEVKKTCSTCMGGIIETRRESTCRECMGRGKVETKRICQECMGDGKAAGAHSACMRCGGLGVVASPSARVQACANCGGKGNVGTTLCDDCKGRGVL